MEVSNHRGGEMRQFFLSMTTTLILLTSCGSGDLENRAAAAETQAQEESERANGLERQLSSALQERNDAQSLADQRKAAADSISTIEIAITLHASPLEGGAVQFPAGGLMGGMTLDRAGGATLAMLETSPGRLASTNAAGEYQVSFNYAPVRLPDVIGRPISSLDGVEDVRAPFERLLKPTGLTLRNGGTASVDVMVNRIRVVAANGVPVAIDETGMVTIPLAPHFQNLFDVYSGAISQYR